MTPLISVPVHHCATTGSAGPFAACARRPSAGRAPGFDRFTAYYGFDRVVRMREREPVHPHQRFACEQLGLHGEHWPAAGTSQDPGDAP